MIKSLLARAREVRAAELEGEGGLEGGFTLIELMVVLLIIAILLAIAIPTFLGVTSSAHDRAVQSNLTNALTEAQAQYQNTQDYSFAATGATPAQGTLNSSAPEFTWVDAAGATVSTDQNTMSVKDFNVTGTDAQGLYIAALNKTTGTCWFVANLQANPDGTAYAGTITRAGTYYSKKTSDGSGCSATQVTNTSTWGSSYASAGTV